MLSKEQVLEAVSGGRDSSCIDRRDYGRLCEFFPSAQWEAFGMKLQDGVEEPTPEPWTHEKILDRLREDVAFGFEKALGQRGISAGLMNEVVKMWLWVLEDDLQHHDDYAQYGLPLLKEVAVKYGFPNEIGEDRGDESRYATD